MELFWKDKYDDMGNWAYLEFHVHSHTKPKLLLKSGVNRKFRLENSKHVLFWGKVEADWYGAWFLRNENKWEPEEMIVPPITSQEIEATSHTTNSEKISHWSKHFANALMKSKESLLFHQTWRLSAANTKNQHTKSNPKWNVSWPEDTFKRQNPHWIDWVGSGGTGQLLALKAPPAKNEGRVKWYRKLIKENRCPPILVWFISALDATIILDGHCRLSAYIEEGIKPEILALSTFMEINDKPDLKKRKNIEKALSQTKHSIPTDRINSLLIEAYDNRPKAAIFTKSIGTRNFSDSWDKQVRQFLKKPDIDKDELEDMLAN